MVGENKKVVGGDSISHHLTIPKRLYLIFKRFLDDLFHELDALGFHLGAERVADLLRVWSQEARLVQRLKAVEEHLGGDSASDSDRLGHARVAVGITKKLKGGGDSFLSRESVIARIEYDRPH